MFEAKYRFLTGRNKWAHGAGIRPFSYPETKEIPVQDVLDAILKHIGMEIKHNPATPEGFDFKVLATQPRTAKTARPNKQKKV